MKSGDNQPDSAPHVYETFSWVVAISDSVFLRQQYLDGSGSRAVQRILDGEPAEAVLGWSAQKLPLARVRSVKWVPAAKTVLIRGPWWRDPWRLKFAGDRLPEQLYHTIAELLPQAREPQEARVGPHDLDLDPRIAIGVFLAVGGLFAMISGALEGLGQAPVSIFEWLFLILGRTLGLTAVILVGVIAGIGGVMALIHWASRRPAKFVIRRGDESKSAALP